MHTATKFKTSNCSENHIYKSSQHLQPSTQAQSRAATKTKVDLIHLIRLDSDMDLIWSTSPPLIRSSQGDPTTGLRIFLSVLKRSHCWSWKSLAACHEAWLLVFKSDCWSDWKITQPRLQSRYLLNLPHSSWLDPAYCRCTAQTWLLRLFQLPSCIGSCVNQKSCVTGFNRQIITQGMNQIDFVGLLVLIVGFGPLLLPIHHCWSDTTWMQVRIYHCHVCPW